MDYNGFQIDEQFGISKDGDPVFTAWHQRCFSLEAAKATIDASNDKARDLPASPGTIFRIRDEDEARERDLRDEEDRMENYYSIEHNQL